MNINKTLPVVFFFVFCVTAWHMSVAQSFTAVPSSLAAAKDGFALWGDLNNDGRPDLIICGTDGVSRFCKMYRNDPDTLVEVNSGILGVVSGDGDLADYDNDGDLDLLICGDGGGNQYLVKVYKNNGDFQFVDLSLSLPGVATSACRWLDYNNDGRQDFVFSGLQYGSINKFMVCRNEGNDQFSTVFDFLGYSDISMDIVDYDHDFSPDILHCGWYSMFIFSYPFTLIHKFENDGMMGYAFSFSDVFSGSCSYADYDNDGDFDIYQSGSDGSLPLTQLYRYDGGNSFVAISTPLTNIENSCNVWGDYNNDGYPDLIQAGQSGATKITRLYNNLSGTLSVSADLFPGISEGSVSFADYDLDGDLDLLVMGNNTAGQAVTQLYRNGSTVFNTKPTAPAGLQYHQSDDKIYLTWSHSTDDHTPYISLTYNIGIGNCADSANVLSPAADLVSGFNRKSGRGNAGLDTNFMVIFPVGQYYWRVQSVDNGYEASPFSQADSFIVNPTAKFMFTDSIFYPDTVVVDTLESPRFLCQYDTINLIYQGNADTSATYFWDFDGGTVVSGQGQGPYEVFWTVAGTKNVGLSVVVGSFSSGIHEESVTVRSKPVAQIDIDANQICYHDSVMVLSYFSDTSYTYAWDFDYASVLSGDSAGPYYVKWDTAGTKIIMLSIASAGCNSDTTSVQTVVKPDAARPEICLVTVDPQSAKNTIIWDKDTALGVDFYYIYKEVYTNQYSRIGQSPVDSMNLFVDYTSNPAAHADKYKVSAVDTCGYESELSFYHKTIILGVSLGVPSSTIVLNWDAYQDESGDFSAGKYYIYRSSTPDNFSIYDSVSGSFTSYNDLNVFSTYFYLVGVKKYPGCITYQKSVFDGSLSNVRSNNVQGINDLQSAASCLTISPNPAGETVTIGFSNPLHHPFELTLSDIAGKVVQRISGSGESEVIDLSNIEKGFYTVSVLSSDHVFAGKLVVE
ncbi:MAG: T9SS type A sorting domain-containing protein [Bacteroidetes bacterium]|nr:T9SS type A sorting domain-containing protein [Bacteroidota bacterium]MBU1718242.1 T9SS type A sorting domain-containing protein [Bacteroidota bacterium]